MCGTSNNGVMGALAGAALMYYTGGLGAAAGTAAAAGTGAAAGAAVGGMADQADAAKKGIEAQDRATKQATEQAASQAVLADEANNRANGKQPDIAGMRSSNELAAKGGQSGTMLTGPTGVDPKKLLLGKTTLLGG